MTSLECSTRLSETVEMQVIFKVAQGFGSKESIYIFNVLFRKIMNVLKLCQMNRNYYNPRAAIMIPRHK